MPERSHTPMGHAHCTSGAPTRSEIPHSLAWSRKAPSIHDVPRGGTVRVLTNRDVKPSGRVLRLCPDFCLREARWWLQLEVRKTSNLHYTTALHTISPVFSHHTTMMTHFHLHDIGRIRNHLSFDATAQLIHALITSCLDFCNSILYNHPNKQIQRLQRIQNQAARMLKRISPRNHITPF